MRTISRLNGESFFIMVLRGIICLVSKAAVGSLWDFLGFPTGIVPDGAEPVDFPRVAYNRIWNEYYRDETLQDEFAETNESILLRNWRKDYFTSSLPWQQRGVALLS